MPERRLPIVEFRSRAELRAWLDRNHSASAGVLVRLYRKGSGVEGIAFEDLLQEGLCFGWSESRRQPGDATGLPGSTHGWVPRSSAVCLNSVR